MQNSTVEANFSTCHDLSAGIHAFQGRLAFDRGCALELDCSSFLQHNCTTPRTVTFFMFFVPRSCIRNAGVVRLQDRSSCKPCGTNWTTVYCTVAPYRRRSSRSSAIYLSRSFKTQNALNFHLLHACGYFHGLVICRAFPGLWFTCPHQDSTYTCERLFTQSGCQQTALLLCVSFVLRRSDLSMLYLEIRGSVLFGFCWRIQERRRFILRSM